jgi:folate-dependent tRNA-U54 methylase TrmFO/GidA
MPNDVLSDIATKTMNLMIAEMKSVDFPPAKTSDVLATMVASSCGALSEQDKHGCFASQCMRFLSLFMREARLMQRIVNEDVEAKHNKTFMRDPPSAMGKPRRDV